jgi:hypothetical protein
MSSSAGARGYYAVHKGRAVGVYAQHRDALAQIQNLPGNTKGIMKKFPASTAGMEAAKVFVRNGPPPDEEGGGDVGDQEKKKGPAPAAVQATGDVCAMNAETYAVFTDATATMDPGNGFLDRDGEADGEDCFDTTTSPIEEESETPPPAAQAADDDFEEGRRLFVQLGTNWFARKDTARGARPEYNVVFMMDENDPRNMYDHVNLPTVTPFRCVVMALRALLQWVERPQTAVARRKRDESAAVVHNEEVVRADAIQDIMIVSGCEALAKVFDPTGDGLSLHADATKAKAAGITRATARLMAKLRTQFRADGQPLPIFVRYVEQADIDKEQDDAVEQADQQVVDTIVAGAGM